MIDPYIVTKLGQPRIRHLSPALAPLTLTQSRSVKRVSGFGQTMSTTADREVPLVESAFDLRQPAREDLASSLLLEPLGLGRVGANPTPFGAHGQNQATVDETNPLAQASLLGDEVSSAKLELIVGGAGDRPRPPR